MNEQMIRTKIQEFHSRIDRLNVDDKKAKELHSVVRLDEDCLNEILEDVLPEFLDKALANNYKELTTQTERTVKFHEDKFGQKPAEPKFDLVAFLRNFDWTTGRAR